MAAAGRGLLHSMATLSAALPAYYKYSSLVGTAVLILDVVVVAAVEATLFAHA